MRPDLPESYYLDNVLVLFAHVEAVYADLLEPSQLGFLQRFAELDEDAKKLYIRLLNRSHDWYRRGKLDYPEIGNLDAAITALEQSGCLRVNAEIEEQELLSLYTRAELLAASSLPGLKPLRRDELEAALREQGDDGFFAALAEKDDLLQVLQRDEYLICQMLFFGNLNQSMTDFVLRDLGLYRYESYPLDPNHRPYRNSLEIQHHWLLYQLEILLALTDIEDRAELLDCFNLIPRDIDPRVPAYRKSQRLGYEIARQLERIGEFESALELYRQCALPPARERCARILAQQGQHHQALDLCSAIIEQPLDDDEIQFAAMFAARLGKRHGLPPLPSIAEHQVTHRPETVDLELEYHESVEVAVAEHFSGRDGACYYLENSLFNGVLGLLIWDAVFAPVSGAFFNPFQHRPSDFYAPDFCARRDDLLQQTWASISNNADIWRIVSARWQQKHGLMNPLVNWQDLELGIIELALERIEFAHWRAVFKRILRDLRHNRAGFPDLVHFPASGGYRLLEVKGPGDSLQKNQQRWMQYFDAHNIPHRLVRVTWQTG